MAKKDEKPDGARIGCNDPVIPYGELDFGFRYGAAAVTRLCSDRKKGWVTLAIETPKQQLQVYVTKTGKVRVHDSNGEWLPSQKD